MHCSWFHQLSLLGPLLAPPPPFSCHFLCFSPSFQEGFTFIHSDTDAIWIANPIPEIFRDGAPDLRLTQGTVSPGKLLLKWGFVVCVGLFWARPTPFTQRFFHLLLLDLFANPRVPKQETDQVCWAFPAVRSQGKLGRSRGLAAIAHGT